MVYNTLQKSNAKTASLGLVVIIRQVKGRSLFEVKLTTGTLRYLLNIIHTLLRTLVHTLVHKLVHTLAVRTYTPTFENL